MICSKRKSFEFSERYLLEKISILLILFSFACLLKMIKFLTCFPNSIFKYIQPFKKYRKSLIKKKIKRVIKKLFYPNLYIPYLFCNMRDIKSIPAISQFVVFR